VGGHDRRLRERQGHAPGAGLSAEAKLRGRREREGGQLLFEIDDRPYKASLDQASGTSRRSGRVSGRTSRTSDGTRRSPRRVAISKQELDDAIQATRGSAAQVQAAEAAVTNARLDLDWTKIYSPIDGIAGIAPVQVGDLVTPSTVLTNVSQLDPMKVTFPITEREYLRFADKIREHQAKGKADDEPDLQLILADGSAYPRPGPVPCRQPRDRPRDRDDPRAGAVPEPRRRAAARLVRQGPSADGDPSGRAPRAGARGAGDPGP
jgi:membrane fusion protein (multidrug efflux system)